MSDHRLPLHECQLNQIKASAGAGKTYALTQHFLELLSRALERAEHPACSFAHRRESHTWQEIMAVTFTNKAATEMKVRIINTLKERALNQVDELPDSPLPKPFGHAAQNWVELILRHYGSLNIRTIDSLLTLILRLTSLELGLPPDFKLMLEPEEYFNPAYDYLMQEAATSNPELADEISKCCKDVLYNSLVTNFIPSNHLRSRLLNLCEHKMKSGDTFYYKSTTPPKAEADEESITKKLLITCSNLKKNAESLHEIISSEGLTVHKNLLTFLTKFAKVLPFSDKLPSSIYIDKPNLEECCNAKSLEPSASAEYRFDSFKITYTEAKILVPYLQNARSNAALSLLSAQIQTRMQANFRESGYIPATMLPALSAGILEDETAGFALFCRMGSSLKHILIDEFQDTSQSQWQALLPLATEALAEGGSLTALGDAKQAIYGWRGGDVRLFDQILSSPCLSNLAEKKQSFNLPYNWRSAEVIVNHNNLVFSRLENLEQCSSLLTEAMPEGTPAEIIESSAKLLQANYLGTKQRLPEGRNSCKGLLSITRMEEPTKEERDERVKEHIKSLLLSDLLLRRPCRDIAFLVRSNNHAFMLADWLTSWQIPVVTENSLLLSHNPIIRQSLAFLRWLNMPLDNLAFFEFICGKELFGHYSGLSTAKLEDWVAKLNAKKADKKAPSFLFHAFRAKWPELWNKLLAPFYNQAGLMNAYDLICELYDRYKISSRFPDEQIFILRFQEILHLAENEGMASLPAFIEWWDAHGNKEKLPMPETLDAIRIMTIHKAKGLEFPVVIIPFGVSQPKANVSFISEEFSGLSLLLNLRKELGEVYYQNLAAQYLETINTLYVAWTRAGEELYILNSVIKKQKSIEKESRRQLMDILLEMFNLNVDGTEHKVGEKPLSSVKSPIPKIPSDKRPKEKACQLPEVKYEPPMNWLPRLKIFRNNLDSPMFDASSRGSFLHQCIQGLSLTDDSNTDAKRAYLFGLNRTIFPRSEISKHESNILKALSWFASLPQAADWLKNGIMEQVITDGSGQNLRCDLIVYADDKLTVIDFKSGQPTQLPDPAHVKQIGKYMTLLTQAQALPVKGILVYLDRQEIVEQ